MANRWRFAAAAAAAAVAMAGAAWGMVVDIPLPILAARSELIVVGTVTDAGPARPMEIKAPDAKQAAKGWYRVSTLKVTRVIRHVPAAAQNWVGKAKPLTTRPAMRMLPPTTRPAAKIETIRVIAPTPRPRPAGAGPGPIMADGPFYPNLRKGQSYVLLLRRLRGRKEYFLPGYFKNCRPAKAEQVAEVWGAADVGNWPWGQAKDGLRLALLPVRRTVRITKTAGLRVLGKDRRFHPAPARTWAPVQYLVALRNVSAKPVAVTVYPEDRFFSLTATKPDGKAIKTDFYEALKRMDLRAFGPWATAALRPGQLIFIQAMGQGDYAGALNLPPRPGKWKLQAGYTAARKAKVGGLDLWTGQITSKPVEVTVQAAK